MSRTNDGIAAVWWDGAAPVILDQRRLPWEVRELRLSSVAEAVEAIATLAVRGAPAIGITAGYALAAAVGTFGDLDHAARASAIRRAASELANVRPTAVNLGWAVRRVCDATLLAPPGREQAAAVREAIAIHEEDRLSCRAIGRHGADFLGNRGRILTHCNTGRLATGGDGTALAIIYAMAERGLRPQVTACESRPLLQGARLTVWELMASGIDVTLISDTAAGAAIRAGRVEAVVVGCDRVAVNGDTANKIGTYQLAVLAMRHGLPMIVAGPLSSFDPDTPEGDAITVEERSPDEVLSVAGARIAPDGTSAWNPAFDITPASLISAWITEIGLLMPPFTSIPSRMAIR